MSRALPRTHYNQKLTKLSSVSTSTLFTCRLSTHQHYSKVKTNPCTVATLPTKLRSLRLRSARKDLPSSIDLSYRCRRRQRLSQCRGRSTREERHWSEMQIKIMMMIQLMKVSWLTLMWKLHGQLTPHSCVNVNDEYHGKTSNLMPSL